MERIQKMKLDELDNIKNQGNEINKKHNKISVNTDLWNKFMSFKNENNSQK